MSLLLWLGNVDGGGGGANYSAIVAETLALAESLASGGAAVVGVDEGLTTVEQLAAGIQLTAAIAEALTIAEQLAAAQAAVISPAEALAIAEALSSAAAFASAIVEAMTIADALAERADFLGSIAESLSIAEGATGTSGGGTAYGASLAETVTILEALLADIQIPDIDAVARFLLERRRAGWIETITRWEIS